jgi:hypothetical protein
LRAIVTLPVLCLPLLLNSGRAQAQELVLDALRMEQRQLLADFHVDGLLTAKIWQGLERGMTSAARFRVQLWRKRGLLLNSLVAERDFELKTAFDPWEQQFLVETWEERRLTKSREYVRQKWERHHGLVLADSTQLDSKHRYYVVVTLRFEPVSRESLQEIRGWLAGEMKSTGRQDSARAAPQKSRGLQDRMLGFVVELTGLGEQSLSLKSGLFRVLEDQLMFEE